MNDLDVFEQIMLSVLVLLGIGCVLFTLAYIISKYMLPVSQDTIQSITREVIEVIKNEGLLR